MAPPIASKPSPEWLSRLHDGQGRHTSSSRPTRELAAAAAHLELTRQRDRRYIEERRCGTAEIEPTRIPHQARRSTWWHDPHSIRKHCRRAWTTDGERDAEERPMPRRENDRVRRAAEMTHGRGHRLRTAAKQPSCGIPPQVASNRSDVA
jgi:hypothetical protein